MAEIIQAITEIEDFFADIVTEISGLDSKNVQISYQQFGRPYFKHGENIIFVSVFPEVDNREIYKNRTSNYDSENNVFVYSQKAQRTLALSLVLYGEGSYEIATRIMHKFYFPEYKYLFDKNFLSIVPDRTDGVIRTMEHFDGQWWNRCDIKFRFYNVVNLETQLPAFDEIDFNVEVDTK